MIVVPGCFGVCLTIMVVCLIVLVRRVSVCCLYIIVLMFIDLFLGMFFGLVYCLYFGYCCLVWWFVSLLVLMFVSGVD